VSIIEASTVRLQTMADGTLRMTVDIEPRNARDAFALFGMPGTALALAAIKPAAQQAQQATAKPAGGPLAKLAGQWCHMPQFLAWSGCNTPDTAAEFVRRECGIESRAELDHNADAAEIFHAHIRVPFANYMMGADG
jgi:hypothetical protein